MKASVLAVTLVLAFASTASAKHVKVYVFAAAQGTDTFQAIPRTLVDSVEDLRNMVNRGIISGLRETSKRAEARILVEVTSREEVLGEFRVHVHVTADGHASDLTGTSVHQWKQAADDIAAQLEAWAHAHPDPSPQQKALIDAGVK